MDQSIKIILGISGSLRGHSYNSALLRKAGQLLPVGYQLQIANPGLLPLYNEDIINKNLPQGLLSFRTAIEKADALLIACPEYNYSFTGVLKNALDWAATNTLGNLLSEKIIALMGASRTVIGTARAQLHLRQVLLAANASVIRRPEVYIRQAQNLIAKDSTIHDERTITKIQELLDALLLQITNLQ